MIIHCPGSLNRCLPHAVAQNLCHSRCRGFFNYLLMAALQGTIALKQMDIIAKSIAENLDFDMARVFDEFFQQHHIIAKSIFGFALARCKFR